MISKKHWSPGSDVSVQSVERRDSGGWIVSGSLTPNGICPDSGLQSRRRHGWRHRRLQDFPAHGDRVTIALQVCRWRCLASACPRRTFSDHVLSIARPFARGTSRVGRLSGIWGMRQAGGLPNGSCAVWASASAMTRCFGNSSRLRTTPPRRQESSA
ncbi:transposase family protein [Roseinatronobacter alkalisoli]|uniref:transposase family protein n=1 Tax=Roseinatronobacter alkalisoli TaxID=3028235 RepID=UPI003B67CFEA